MKLFSRLILQYDIYIIRLFYYLKKILLFIILFTFSITFYLRRLLNILLT